MKKNGFTLIELLIAISIFSILAAIAAMSFNSYILKAKIKGFSENLAADIKYAQNEARATKGIVCLEFTTGESWAYTFRKVNKNENCGSNGVIIKSKTFSEINKTSIDYVKVNGENYNSTNIPKFDGQKGKISGYVPVEISMAMTTGDLYNIRLNINPIGLIQFCSPDTSAYVGGYSKC